METRVSLREVIDALGMASAENQSFLNVRTGETLWLMNDDLRAAEDGDFDPESIDENVEFALKVLGSSDWVALPSSHEINEWQMLRDFAEDQEDPEHRDQLLRAIRGRGAFRFFKDTAERLGLREAWYACRDERYAEFAIDWLEDNDIAFEDDRNPPPGA